MIEKRKKGPSIFEPPSTTNSGEPADEKKAYLRVTTLLSLVNCVLLVVIFVYFFGKDDAVPNAIPAPPRVSQGFGIPHNDVSKYLETENVLPARAAPLVEPAAVISAPEHAAPENVNPELLRLTTEANNQIEKLRKMKQSGKVMEKDPEALQEIALLQRQLQTLIPMKYGPGPYQVAMTIQFPESMLTDPAATVQETILIDMAPISLVPYCVYYFLEIVANWKVRYLMVYSSELYLVC